MSDSYSKALGEEMIANMTYNEENSEEVDKAKVERHMKFESMETDDPIELPPLNPDGSLRDADETETPESAKDFVDGQASRVKGLKPEDE